MEDALAIHRRVIWTRLVRAGKRYARMRGEE